MQCAYIYEEDRGKHKKGDRCGSPWAFSDRSNPGYGFCFRHATEKKLVSNEKLKDVEDKRRNGVISAWRGNGYGAQKLIKKVLENDEIRDEKKAQLIEEEKKKKKDTQELLHKILGDENYDAREMLREFKEANADFKYTDKIRKFIFIGWYISDVLTRKPGTLMELCSVLGMTTAEGRDWIDSDWFVTDFNNAMKKMLKLADPYLNRINLTKALSGDFNAFKEYNRRFGKHERVEGETDWDDELSEDVKMEAEEVMNSK